MGFNDINLQVSGPQQPASTYKTKVLKGQVPFATQVTEPNTKYVIKHNFVLNGDVTIPENCILEFDGGSISGEHTINGQNTKIEGKVKLSESTFGGTFALSEVYIDWFGENIDRESFAMAKKLAEHCITSYPNSTYGTYTSVISQIKILCINKVLTDIDNVTLGNFYYDFTGSIFNGTDKTKTLFVGTLWRTIINGGSFIKYNKVFDITTNNVDAAILYFENIKMDTCNYGIYTTTCQSSIITIKHCYFGGGLFTRLDSDNATIDSCWVKGDSEDGACSILNYNRLQIYNSIFVPGGTNNVTLKRRWIDNHGASLIIENNRFGGEGGSRPVVYNYRKGDYAYGGQTATIVMHDNMALPTQSAYKTPIVLFEMPNLIDFKGVPTATGAAYLVACTGDGFDVTDYEANSFVFRICVDDTIFKHQGYDISYVSDNLVQFLHKPLVVDDAQKDNILNRETLTYTIDTAANAYRKIAELRAGTWLSFLLTYNAYNNAALTCFWASIYVSSGATPNITERIISLVGYGSSGNFKSPVYYHKHENEDVWDIIVQCAPGANTRQSITVLNTNVEVSVTNLTNPDTSNYVHTLIRGFGSGQSTQKPDGTNIGIGYQFFDETNKKPIWWNGSAWVDATGATV